MVERNWWPEEFAGDWPAFRVKRESVGLHTGGDYVRGSADNLLATAIRFPTKSLDPSIFEPSARGVLFAQPFDYQTVQIDWNWPTSVEAIFQEVAIVRSAFGKPQAPLQGVTIYRKLRSELPTTTSEQTGKTTLNPPPTLFDEFPATTLPDGSPGKVPCGHWYYYTAFFRTNPIDWAALMYDQTLLPRNWSHTSHLWNAVPPWYQYTDDNQGESGNGPLRRFLTAFGFEMDLTREYVESLLNLHWADQSPIMLLKHLGENYGLPYEQGLGDIRYRGMVANYSHMLSRRGTARGLLEFVETTAKYDCDLTQGTNNVLLPDDSDFQASAGHWAPAHPTLNYTQPPATNPLKADYLTYDKVTLTVNPKTGGGAVPPPSQATGATGTLLIDTLSTDTLDIFLTLGAGKYGTDEFVPFYTGIPASPNEVYGFSMWLRMQTPSAVKLGFLTFQSKGQVSDVSATAPSWGNSVTPTANTWTQMPTANVQVPTDAHYIVPCLYVDARSMTGGTGGRSPRIDIAAVMVWEIKSDVPVSLLAPNEYLTLGDQLELLGTDRAQGGGWRLGTP